jgi:hypothetical protein
LSAFFREVKDCSWLEKEDRNDDTTKNHGVGQKGFVIMINGQPYKLEGGNP